MGVGVDVGLESRTALVLHRPHAQLGIDRVGIDRTAGRIWTHLGLLCADTCQRAYHQSVRAKASISDQYNKAWLELMSVLLQAAFVSQIPHIHLSSPVFPYSIKTGSVQHEGQSLYLTIMLKRRKVSSAGVLSG